MCLFVTEKRNPYATDLAIPFLLLSQNTQRTYLWRRPVVVNISRGLLTPRKQIVQARRRLWERCIVTTSRVAAQVLDFAQRQRRT